ncbi:TolC family protein [Fidelibacter multiformis]|uniref:TolC family protein n=1 Tax=Fidelibacter multiformis TaxID=3377529 RepID=UPI0037DDD813
MKHPNRSLFSVLILFVISVLPVQGEELTLEAAEKIALENNIQLKMAEASLQKAEAGFREAIGGLMPTFSAYGQYTKNFELPVVVIDIPGAGPQSITMGSTYNSTGGLSVSQPLFTSGALYSSLRMAKTGEEIAKIQKEQEKNSVILTVRTLYQQILLVESLVQATENSQRSALANFEMVQKMKSVGKANQFEVLQAEVKYREISPRLMSLKNQKKNLVTNLITFLNLETGQDIELSGELTLMDNPFRESTLEKIKQEALENRYELVLLKHQEKMLKSQRILAASGALPKVSLSADVRHQAQAESQDDMEYYRSKNASVSISIPLLSGGKHLASVQQASIDLKKHELQVEQTIDFILSDVEKAYLKVFESREKVEANATLVEQADEALRMVKIMYENGGATQVEVLNAESGALGARSSYLSSVFEFNTAILQLKQAINKL